MKKNSLSTTANMTNFKVSAPTSNAASDGAKSANLQYYQSREEQLKMIEDVEFKKRANIQMNKVVNRFLNYKIQELRLEDYEDEEIEAIIEKMLNDEMNDYYDYSSDEDNNSVYSDDETF